MTDPLWSLGLSGTQDAYRQRLTTPSDVLEATLERIAACEPTLNAFAHLDISGARAAASASTARWQRLAPAGPLDGAMVSIKDNIPVAGLPCAWGSRLFEKFVPDQDELPVARLRDSGAVLLGKTNVSEFTLGRGTVSTELFGTTRNPWNPALTTGASSGGAASAVASGMGAAALGTDGGGSIRRPASHCGIVGLKPGTGRVPRRDGLPVILHDCEVIGPLARTVADAALLYQAICQPDPMDRLSWSYGGPPGPPPPTRALRIRYVPCFGDHQVDDAVASRCAAAARLMDSLGHTVETGPPPFDTALHEAFWPVISAAGMAWLLRDRDWQGKIGAYHAELVERGVRLTAVDYIAALTAFRRLASQLGAFFTSYDLLMSPAAGAVPWPAERDGPPHERVFTGFANAAGLPAMVLPTAGDGAVPIGVQFVAAHRGEPLLLAAAAELEKAQAIEFCWPLDG